MQTTLNNSSSHTLSNEPSQVPDLKMRNAQGKMREGFRDITPIIASFLTGNSNENDAEPNDFNALASYVSTTAKHDKLSLLFASPLEKEKQARLILVIKLLGHVVKGELEEVEEMLEEPANHYLLLYSARVKTYSHGDMEAKNEKEIEYQEMEGTALGLAFAAKAVGIRGKEDMVELIKSVLKQLPNGEAEIKKQQKKQFPDGWEAKQKQREKADSAALKKVIRAIAKSKTDDEPELKNEMHQFRAHVKASNRLITSGYQFNDQLLIKAFQLYAKNYSNFGGYDSRRNNLVWREVMGYIARFLPANYAQAVCQGIWEIMKDTGTHWNLSVFFHDVLYPLDRVPNFLLGKHFSVGGNQGIKANGGPYFHVENNEMWGEGKVIEKFCKTKTKVVHELMRHDLKSDLQPKSHSNKPRK